MNRRTLTLPLNRVEGDLEVRVDITDNRVVSAQVAGTMFRGFEQMMKGRGALDGLVITPRICGICSTSHLYAAALALDDLQQSRLPANAVRMRNLTHIAEHLQSDLRHAILMFAVDFAHEGYAKRGFYSEALRCYAPVKGESAISAIRATRLILEIVAIIGGQWPHSSFMVPGGIVSTPSSTDLRKCRLILEEFSGCYQQQILGGPLAAWEQVKTTGDLQAWCSEPAHRQADLARIYHMGCELGLDQGTRDNILLSAGSLPLPTATEMPGQQHFSRPGLWNRGVLEEFDAALISENLASSFYQAEKGSTKTIFQQTTIPDPDRKDAYSWVKTPAYRGLPAETSPLAELLCNRHPLMTAWVQKQGVSPLARELARLLRAADFLPLAERWLQQTDPNQPYYAEPPLHETGRGLGLVQASRGMLGHWLEIEEDRISNYQIITPTAWNAAPRNGRGEPGPIEQALLGAVVEDPAHPLELGHIVRSFDPCLVCAVHSLHKKGRSTLRLGAP